MKSKLISKPQDMQKKILKQMVFIFGLLFAVLLISRWIGGNRFEAWIQVPAELQDQEDLHIISDDESVLRVRESFRNGDRIRIVLEPVKAGAAGLLIQGPKGGEVVVLDYFRVGQLKTVYQESTGEFAGDRALIFCAFIFLCCLSGLLLLNFYRAKGTALYSYTKLHSIGFGIFTLFAAIVLAISIIRLYADPEHYNMRSVFSGLTQAASYFMYYTIPFVLVFAVLMAVSNISLLRHEGRRLRNMFGILIGVLLVVGEVAGFLLNRYVSGSEMEVLVHDTLYSLYCTIFVYFECILIGSIICGFRAARFEPVPDKDYILILGCKILGDGTLTPLLRGRADKAVAFAKEQEKTTGKKAILVPSGGQGPDEVMAEAEAMKRYLLSIGVPEDRIRMENGSRNTYENMAFSKELIEKENPSARVCFSTTNYHVFRSGLWAQLAGLDAEGMGSRTKWYFWPNAFMRECVGLMANHVRSEIILLVLFAAFYAALTVLLN